MGLSCGGVAFQQNTWKLVLKTVIQDLFGKEFKQNTEYCDSRSENCVFIAKTEDFLFIFNAEFTNKFFKQEETEIDKYLSYFSYPEWVIAFEQYDSSNTYSYARFQKWKLKRCFRTEGPQTTLDFGEKEPIENEWLNGSIIEEITEDNETEYIVIRDDGSKTYQRNLRSTILQDLILRVFGSTLWDIDSTYIEQWYYTKKQKLWWKLW